MIMLSLRSHWVSLLGCLKESGLQESLTTIPQGPKGASSTVTSFLLMVRNMQDTHTPFGSQPSAAQVSAPSVRPCSQEGERKHR